MRCSCVREAPIEGCIHASRRKLGGSDRGQEMLGEEITLAVLSCEVVQMRDSFGDIATEFMSFSCASTVAIDCRSFLPALPERTSFIFQSCRKHDSGVSCV